MGGGLHVKTVLQKKPSRGWIFKALSLVQGKGVFKERGLKDGGL